FLASDSLLLPRSRGRIQEGVSYRHRPRPISDHDLVPTEIVSVALPLLYPPPCDGGGDRLRVLATLVRPQVDDVRQAARIGAAGVDVELLDLLRSRRRQALHDVDPARRLVVGEALVAMVEQRRRCVLRRYRTLEHDAGQDLLVAQLV